MAACKVTARCMRSSYDILIDLPEAMHKDLNCCLLLMCNISLSQIIIVHTSHLFNIIVNSVHYHSEVQIHAVWFSFLKLITKKVYFFLITAQQTTFVVFVPNQVFVPNFPLWSHLFWSDGNKIKQQCCCKSKTKDYSSVKKKRPNALHIQFETLLEKNTKSSKQLKLFPWLITSLQEIQMP